jgi:hypothetical protein
MELLPFRIIKRIFKVYVKNRTAKIDIN